VAIEQALFDQHDAEPGAERHRAREAAPPLRRGFGVVVERQCQARSVDFAIRLVVGLVLVVAEPRAERQIAADPVVRVAHAKKGLVRVEGGARRADNREDVRKLGGALNFRERRATLSLVRQLREADVELDAAGFAEQKGAKAGDAEVLDFEVAAVEEVAVLFRAVDRDAREPRLAESLVVAEREAVDIRGVAVLECRATTIDRVLADRDEKSANRRDGLLVLRFQPRLDDRRRRGGRACKAAAAG